MNQTVCNNQPPSILLVDIPYQRNSTTRVLLYRGEDARQVYAGRDLSLSTIEYATEQAVSDCRPQLTLVTGAHAEVIADNLRAKGCPAIHHR